MLKMGYKLHLKARCKKILYCYTDKEFTPPNNYNLQMLLHGLKVSFLFFSQAFNNLFTFMYNAAIISRKCHCCNAQPATECQIITIIRYNLWLLFPVCIGQMLADLSGQPQHKVVISWEMDQERIKSIHHIFNMISDNSQVGMKTYAHWFTISFYVNPGDLDILLPKYRTVFWDHSHRTARVGRGPQRSSGSMGKGSLGEIICQPAPSYLRNLQWWQLYTSSPVTIFQWLIVLIVKNLSHEDNAYPGATCTCCHLSSLCGSLRRDSFCPLCSCSLSMEIQLQGPTLLQGEKT